MDYLLIRMDDGRELLQEVFAGNVQRYTDLDGNTVPTPWGGAEVVEVIAAPAWAPPDPAPIAVPDANAPRYITGYAFLVRFTDTEAIGIDLASQGATVHAAAMRRYQAKMTAAKWIDLDAQATREGVQTLEAVGLIAPGRALEILDAPVSDDERP